MTSDASSPGDCSGLPGEDGSLWLAPGGETTDYPALDSDESVDAVVVGGGIAGVTTAAELAADGVEVVLLEADRIVEGVTGHTTAKLTSQHGLIYDHVRSHFGEQEAQLYGEANEAAIDHVEDQVASRGIDCEFERTPAFTYVEHPDPDAEQGGRDQDAGGGSQDVSGGSQNAGGSGQDVEKLRQAIQTEAETTEQLGLPASYTESTPLLPDVAGAVRFDEQARFDPRAYLLDQAERVVEEGGRIYEQTRATDLREGSRIEVETEGGIVTADDAVVATHFPIHDHGLYFARLRPKKGYVLAVRLEDPPEGLYYRAGDPYFSVRPHPAGDETLALVGGENHRTGHGGDAAERYRKLEREAHEYLEIEEVVYRWSTQDFVSVDGVPFVGQLAPQTDGVYVATGFGGWGMTNGVAAGLLLADQLRGVDNEWAAIYDPSRLEIGASATDLAAQAWHTAHNYATERLGSGIGEETPSLANGEGTVVHEGTSAVGHYRDDDGERHTVSAVCPHMGCVVEWNGADRTWECPCHGSRFEYDGSVIDGPAETGLDDR